MNDCKKLFSDPRSFLFLFLTSYTIYALMTPGFNRNWVEIFLTMFTCVLVDYALLYWYKKVNMFPISGMISSFGIFLMSETQRIWIYPLIAILAILSKHFIVYNKKHIFNPNNIAIVFGILFLENHMTIVNGTWGGKIEIALTIFALGCLLVYKVNRMPLVLSFLSSFIVLAILRSWILNVPLIRTFFPLTGPAFFLFTFYMVTDPATTPKKPERQVVFGILLALIDSIFRFYQNKYAPVLSLFILTGIYPIISDWIEDKIKLVSSS